MTRLTKKKLIDAIKNTLDWGVTPQAIILDMLSRIDPKWEKDVYQWMCENSIIDCRSDEQIEKDRQTTENNKTKYNKTTIKWR